MSNEVFQKYKDKHKGERVFLIGNGPSLADTNLDLIKDEYSIAMNRISLIYDKNPEWRPTYYLFSSTNCKNPVWGRDWSKSVEDAATDPKTTPFIASVFKDFIDPWDEFSQINYFESMSETKPDIQGNISENCFSRNVIERIDKSGTTMNLALQLVYHMGFSEVVFLGTDLGWSFDQGSEADPNHFDKSYRANISNPEKANYQMRNIHSLALKNFSERSEEVKFYNATLRSVLDVYPMIDYEKYILENEVKILEDSQDRAKNYWSRPPQYGSLI